MMKKALSLLLAALLLALAAVPAMAELNPAVSRYSITPAEFLKAPANLKSGVNGTTVTLEWTKADAKADGFAVYEFFKDNRPALIFLGQTQKTSFTVKNVSKGKHTYAVLSFQKDPTYVVCEDMPQVTATVKTNGKVGVATGLELKQTAARKVKLSWKKADKATKYVIYRSTQRNKGFKKIASVTKNSYEDKVPSSGKTYYYRIRAVRTTKKNKYTTTSSTVGILVNKDYKEKAAGTVRALLIGNTYKGTEDYLPGTDRDVKYMEKMLKLMKRSDVQITTKYEAKTTDIYAGIEQAFAGATKDDISIFYYSGHGDGPNEMASLAFDPDKDTAGALIGTDKKRITPKDLRTALDKIPGKKVVILDSCFSGMHIFDDFLEPEEDQGENGSAAIYTKADAARVNASILSAFRSANNLADEGYYVITAANMEEVSASEVMGTVGGKDVYGGKLTHALLMGCGYDELTGAKTRYYPADANGDGNFTIEELFNYVNNRIMTSYEDGQHTQQYWPKDGGNQIVWQR